MFNKSILEKVLAQYKQDFVLTQWKMKITNGKP